MQLCTGNSEQVKKQQLYNASMMLINVQEEETGTKTLFFCLKMFNLVKNFQAV